LIKKEDEDEEEEGKECRGGKGALLQVSGGGGEEGAECPLAEGLGPGVTAWEMSCAPAQSLL
jgi:hypothetical protein